MAIPLLSDAFDVSLSRVRWDSTLLIVGARDIGLAYGEASDAGIVMVSAIEMVNYADVRTYSRLSIAL